MTKRICCIFNIGPHYRQPIYTLMDQKLNCDFYFGDKVDSPIKIMDYSSLSGYQKTVKNKRITKYRLHWQVGIWKLIFKPYTHYIITGNTNSITNWLLLLLAIPLRKKIHAWTHGMKGISSPKGKLIEKYFYRLCTSVLLYGNFSKEIMLKEGIKNSKLVPIYNSLDYDKQLVLRKKLVPSSLYQDHFKNNNPIIVYIGRIQKLKKIDLLIESLNVLTKDGLPCNLVLIGKDVDGNNLQDLVKKYGLEKQVWFYGLCYNEEEISSLIYNSDVCVSPGHIGLTAIHSLSYGTPVITHNDFPRQAPEFEAITTGVNGDFFKKNDLNDLVLTIKKWIRLDKIRREKVRKTAYQTIDERYNPHYQIKILKQLLNISE